MTQGTPLTPQILQRIDALAAQLGTTAEYLWPALVKQQVALGVGGLILLVIIGAAFALCLHALLKWLPAACADEPESVGPFVKSLLFGSVLFMSLIAGTTQLAVIGTNLARIIAPEAYALQELLP